MTNAFSSKPSFSLSDRFRVTCPADIASISQYDPALIKNDENNNSNDTSTKSIWAAVYRSSNNLPSVLIKDDFMNAMRIATTESTQVNDAQFVNQIEKSSTAGRGFGNSNADDNNDSGGGGVKAQTPVAVANLIQSKDFDGKWVLESMRCSLKKEDTDDLCDGQSEHAEAISVCIDELILNHLREGRKFDGCIRTKATLVSGVLLGTRGFQEVNELSRDMATHVSSLEDSLNKYAERAVETVSMSPGARDRALQILSFLGKQEVVEVDDKTVDDGNSNDYDPWANVGRL